MLIHGISKHSLHLVCIGADIKYAYGWVDMDSRDKIPLELVVGISRDPIMLACIRVSNMKESIRFFIDKLGMSEQPFPLARQPGSNFEQVQSPGSTFLSYAPDTMGLLLVPSKPKDIPLEVGNELRSFNFVVDDKNTNSLPPLIQEFIDGGAATVSSPDGYPISFIKYSEFSKKANKSL
jgi:hypothetical protein